MSDRYGTARGLIVALQYFGWFVAGAGGLGGLVAAMAERAPAWALLEILPLVASGLALVLASMIAGAIFDTAAAATEQLEEMRAIRHALAPRQEPAATSGAEIQTLRSIAEIEADLARFKSN